MQFGLVSVHVVCKPYELSESDIWNTRHEAALSAIQGDLPSPKPLAGSIFHHTDLIQTGLINKGGSHQ